MEGELSYLLKYFLTKENSKSVWGSYFGWQQNQDFQVKSVGQ